MKRVALGALIVASAYVTGSQPADPSLTRIAPDRARPNQRVLSLGFWGASADLLLVGPDLDAFYGRKMGSGRPPYPMTAIFSAAWVNDHPELGAFVRDVARRGYLRMEPSLWYGIRPEVGDRLVPNGRSALEGRFFLVTPKRPTAPAGWRIESSKTERVQLAVRCAYEAGGGGGTQFWLLEPKGWRLAEIGLDADQPYVGSFGPAWNSPFSEWVDPKPASALEAMREYRFRPTVWAEVTNATLIDERTGERRRTVTPTGWVEAAGRFHRATP